MQPWAFSLAACVVRTPCLARTSGSCLALVGSEASEPYGSPSPVCSACIEAVRHRQSSSRRKCLTWCTSKLVPKGGLEPPRPFGHRHLRPARLPFRHPGRVFMMMVPREGFEPSQPYGHRPLMPACLPVPPPGHFVQTASLSECLSANDNSGTGNKRSPVDCREGFRSYAQFGA